MVGRVEGFGGHNLLFGYEFQRDKYRTEVTAGDDPDCICGYWWLTIAPMDITTLEETQPPLDIETIARTTFVNDRIHSFYWQDQIDIAPQREGQHRRTRRRLQSATSTREGGLPFTPVQPGTDGLHLQSRRGLRAALRPAALLRHRELVYTGEHGAGRRITTRPQHRSQLRGRSPLAGIQRAGGYQSRRLPHHPQQRRPFRSR